MNSWTGRGREIRNPCPSSHAARDQRGHLLVGLDAFRMDLHLQLAGELHEHPHDGVCSRIAADRVDEELVDLENVRAEPLNLREAAMADADVVDGDLEAVFA